MGMCTVAGVGEATCSKTWARMSWKCSMAEFAEICCLIKMDLKGKMCLAAFLVRSALKSGRIENKVHAAELESIQGICLPSKGRG